MKVIAYLERPDQTLSRYSAIDVPDNSADPIDAAWRLINRGNVLPAGQYILAAKPKRIKLDDTIKQVGTDLGTVS